MEKDTKKECKDDPNCSCDELECEEIQEDQEGVDVFLDEETGEQYFIELNEETLQERKIIIRITSRGKRIKKIRCPKGRVLKNVNGRQVCATPTGSEKISKKLAIRKANRTKTAKGTGYKKRITFKRGRAMRFRKAMGVKNNQQG